MRDERKFKEVICTIKGAVKDDLRLWTYCTGYDLDILILLYAVLSVQVIWYKYFKEV